MDKPLCWPDTRMEEVLRRGQWLFYDCHTLINLSSAEEIRVFIHCMQSYNVIGSYKNSPQKKKFSHKNTTLTRLCCKFLRNLRK